MRRPTASPTKKQRLRHKEIAPEWVRAAAMKSVKADSFKYDVTTETKRQKKIYNERMRVYETSRTSSPAPEIPEEVDAGTEETAGDRLI